MSVSFAELSNLAPPSDDGAIERALSELETKLGAWSDAMSTAHRRLAERIQTCTNSDATGENEIRNIAPEPPIAEAESPASVDRNAVQSGPIVESEANPQVSGGTENDEVLDRLSNALRHSEHLARELGSEDETENPKANEPSPASETTDEGIEEILATIESDVADMLRARHAAAGGKVSMRDVCDEYFAEVTETEKLLSTLEPEMAKAIRVQYRLFNGRKSIRQLVDAYEPPKEKSNKRKSWWRG
ncbi:MAG: hypothetical protein H6819_07670 [Phycisphaerales bacterium]|nr:hypothetical protein [Phycisphaerales bacterium]MCB9857627.1 hypothetical protein [Phycisphaerales bacterium]MCB9864816.1 hypothetical protein [Phycisphaerales bacterium]